jgi:hypothetical protein
VVEKLKGIYFNECQIFLSFFKNGSKEFDNLRLLDVTKASLDIVEIFIQGQGLNSL